MTPLPPSPCQNFVSVLAASVNLAAAHVTATTATSAASWQATAALSWLLLAAGVVLVVALWVSFLRTYPLRSCTGIYSPMHVPSSGGGDGGRRGEGRGERGEGGRRVYACVMALHIGVLGTHEHFSRRIAMGDMKSQWMAPVPAPGMFCSARSEALIDRRRQAATGGDPAAMGRRRVGSMVCWSA
jgi:hypothetical protein